MQKNPEQHSAFLLTNKAPRPLNAKSTGRKVMLRSLVSGRGLFIGGAPWRVMNYMRHC